MTQRYDLIVWAKIPQGEDKDPRTIARRVGSAKALDNGMIQCFLTQGIGLTGRFTVAPWTPKDKESKDAEDIEEGQPGDE